MRISGGLIGIGFVGSIFLPILGNVPAIQILSLVLGCFGIVLKKAYMIPSITLKYFVLTIFIFTILSVYPLIITSSILAIEKILMVTYNIFCPLISGLFFISVYSLREQKKILVNISIIFLSICLILSYGGTFEVLDNREFPTGYGNPIWYARAIGVALIISSISLRAWSPMWLYTMIAAVYLLIQSPTRSVVLGVLITLSIVFLNQKRNAAPLLLKYFLLTSLAGVGILLNIDNLFLNQNIYSVLSRLEFYKFAIEGIIVSPFGHGVASFGLDYFGVDERNYPHNIFLELGYEFGFLSLIAFCLFCMRSVFPLLGLYQPPFLFFLVSACFSGDIAGNGMLFVLGIVVLIVKKRCA